ncbi:MAG TPA: hypothetical protein VHW74_03670 [Mycobacteriales bacterium]|nr:hypothetical protein [Mycobacteriales bacterium]
MPGAEGVLALESRRDTSGHVQLLVEEARGIARAKNEEIDLRPRYAIGRENSTFSNDRVVLWEPVPEQLCPDLLTLVSGGTRIFGGTSPNAPVLGGHFSEILFEELNQLVIWLTRRTGHTAN